MNYMHQLRCPLENRIPETGHSDAARRIADTYALHRLADLYSNMGQWMACRLDDGTSDNVLYDSKASAIRHQKHNEDYFTFIQMTPAQMTACEAEIMLKIDRMIYNANGRNRDGYVRHSIIKRSNWEDQIALSKGIVTNVRLGRKPN